MGELSRWVIQSGPAELRIVLTLINGLKRRGGGLGIAAICSGGGQGDAVLIRVDG